MNAKQILTVLFNAMAVSLVGAAVVNAASTQKVYSSGLLVLLFLGFCVLVVTVQLIPALLTIYGMIKCAVNGKKTAPETTTG